jgi:hypothetical protein
VSGWSASCPGRFASPPIKRAPGTNWIGEYVGPRPGLDVVTKGKIPTPTGNRNPVVKPLIINSLNLLIFTNFYFLRNLSTCFESRKITQASGITSNIIRVLRPQIFINFVEKHKETNNFANCFV